MVKCPSTCYLLCSLFQESSLEDINKYKYIEKHWVRVDSGILLSKQNTDDAEIILKKSNLPLLPDVSSEILIESKMSLSDESPKDKKSSNDSANACCGCIIL